METTYKDEMKRLHAVGARLSYLHSLLPDELRRDPTAASVANHFARQDGFSVEGCLVEMVRALVKAGDSMRHEHIKLLELTGPTARLIPPSTNATP